MCVYSLAFMAVVLTAVCYPGGSTAVILYMPGSNQDLMWFVTVRKGPCVCALGPSCVTVGPSVVQVCVDGGYDVGSTFFCLTTFPTPFRTGVPILGKIH